MELFKKDGNSVKLSKKDIKSLKSYISTRLYSKLYRRVDKDDIFQETLIEIHKRLPKYLEHKKVPFSKWIIMIAREKIIEAYRTHILAACRSLDNEKRITTSIDFNKDDKGEENEFDYESDYETPEKILLDSENEQFFCSIFSIMNDQDKNILYMRHMGRMTNEEVAERMGMSINAVSMRYLRARRRLKEIIIGNSKYMEYLL